ncbi:MAG: zinc-dependent metalloprotease [Acidimicrobiales bacterium]
MPAALPTRSREQSDEVAALQSELEPDLLRLTSQAEELVADETGLVSLAGSAKARVTGRMGWVDANLASFDRLARPLLGKFDDEDDEPGPLGRLLQPVSDAVGPRVAGAELGAMLGWMSGRVIGQYDLLIIEDERPEDQDWVYYVGPNVTMLEERYGFPPEEFRLWIAIHECTHRAQFTAVPWLRPYFLAQVEALLDAVDPDPARLLDAAKQVAANKRAGKDSGLDAGLSQLLASPEQKVILDRLTGLMSLLEGHGDKTMDRAGRGVSRVSPGSPG